MHVTLNYRQVLLKSEIVSKLCRIVIAEMDGGGEIVSTIEFLNDNPDSLIDLGQDIIMAALNLKQQLAQEGPADAFTLARAV
jgi:hypothetical protein